MLNQKFHNLSSMINKIKSGELSNASLQPRNIIIHYHLFKNAGTSLDYILKNNFKNAWREYEIPRQKGILDCDALTEYLKHNREVVVLSSHTARMPVPELPNTNIYPIIFIRDPIDRIRSIYQFERKQPEKTPGSDAAKNYDFSGYVRWRLSREGDRAIENFQTLRVSEAVSGFEGTKKLSEQERMHIAVQRLPFIGVVEHFNETIEQLQNWLSPFFSGINFSPIKLNASKDSHDSLTQRRQWIREELGNDLYEELLRVNELDLKLHKQVSALYH